MKFLIKIIVVFIALVASKNLVFGQTDDAMQSILVKTEQVYGVDDLLMNGQRYKRPNPLAEGHPYFENELIRYLTIFIKGEIYENVEGKYDLQLNTPLLKTTAKDAWFEYVIGNPLLIDSFELSGRKFINARLMNGEGYLEKVYGGGFSFYWKHGKLFQDVHNTRYRHGFYVTQKPVAYIFDNGQLTKLKNKKAFLKYFEKDKKAVKKYFRNNSIIFKKASREELFGLLKFCDEL